MMCITQLLDLCSLQLTRKLCAPYCCEHFGEIFFFRNMHGILDTVDACESAKREEDR